MHVLASGVSQCRSRTTFTRNFATFVRHRGFAVRYALIASGINQDEQKTTNTFVCRGSSHPPDSSECLSRSRCQVTEFRVAASLVDLARELLNRGNRDRLIICPFRPARVWNTGSSTVVGSNSSSVQFAEICQASFGSAVERRYMMRGNSAGTWLPNHERVDSNERRAARNIRRALCGQ
jgi:hypothetical protein